MFDRFLVVDWSGGNDTGARPRKDAIWIGAATAQRTQEPVYCRSRACAEIDLANRIETTLAAGETLCAGFDFPFGYPHGFASDLTGSADPLAVWAWFSDHVQDTPKANNRFDLAGQINLRLGGNGPFWGNAMAREIAGLARTKAGYKCRYAERRQVEYAAKGSFTCWQLAGAGAVGSQIIMGLPVLQRLRRQFAPHVSVWPFEPMDPGSFGPP